MIEEKVNDYVESQLSGYRHKFVHSPKIIHDTILGSNIFRPFEIALIDLPIIQRLRRINQVDVVPLVFPSGNHNRFEHTLGVTVISEQLALAVVRRIIEGQEKGIKKYKKIKIEKDYIINHVRVAAIMHDCGHGPFSHMSERIYGLFEDIKHIRKKNKKFNGASPHEILGYLIVTSRAFKEFFKEEIADKYKVDIDLKLVADMIIGYVGKRKNAFLIEIINGAFDADKIDYIQRDSHFTGIKMVLDTHRLFHTVDIIVDDKDKYRLSIDLSGVATLEQIIFNKMMLFSTVYHHHKVRAAECLFMSIFEEIKNGDETIIGYNFDSSADFLYLIDDDIYSLSKIESNPIISEFARNLKERNLPMRSFVISGRTIESNDIAKLGEIMSFFKSNSNVIQLRKTIVKEVENLGQAINVYDVWVDIPDPPSFKEGINWPVKSIGGKKDYICLRGLFPVDDWVRAFSENKWKGYVFTRPQYREVVYKATKKILEEIFDINFNEASRTLCKMDNEFFSK